MSKAEANRFRSYWIKRLNVLLRFARVDPWKLNDGALEKLKGEMFFAVMGDPSPLERQFFRPGFDRLATREALSEAQRGLDRALQRLLVKPTTAGALYEFKVAGGDLLIRLTNGAFDSQFHTDHFPTQVYKAFTDMLKASGVKQTDFLHCSHCGTLLVPLRKPRKGTPSYCSMRCANIVAMRNYRKRQAEVRLKKKGQSYVNVMKSRGKL